MAGSMGAKDISVDLSAKRRCFAYVPWLSLISFLFVLAGTITWAVGASSAITNTGDMLSALKLDVQPYMKTTQRVAVFSVCLCCLLAALMLAMSGGRSCTERAVDQRGQATRGSRYWLGFSATLTIIWWLVLVLLMFVLLLSAVWYGVTYGSSGVLRLSTKTADKAVARAQQLKAVTATSVTDAVTRLSNNTSASSSSSSSSPLSPADVAAALAALVPALSPLAAVTAGDSDNATSCPSECLNLAMLEFVLKRDVCICTTTTLRRALNYSEAAHRASGAVLAGACLLWAGASFLLMNAAAEYAQARRERALLLRAQRCCYKSDAGVMASDAAALATAAGGAGSGTPGVGSGAGEVGGSGGALAEQQQQWQQVMETMQLGGGYAADADDVPLLLKPEGAPLEQAGPPGVQWQPSLGQSTQWQGPGYQYYPRDQTQQQQWQGPLSPHVQAQQAQQQPWMMPGGQGPWQGQAQV